MIEWRGAIHHFDYPVKMFITAFLLALSFGYFSGFKFVGRTMNYSPEGISQNYLGNEEDMRAELMKFKKSENEVLTIIHTHVLSLSMIFLVLGLLLFTTSLHPTLRNLLAIEPFVSLIVTFGGIWLLWKGWYWVAPVIMVSGILLNLSFVLAVLLLLWQLLFVKTTQKSNPN